MGGNDTFIYHVNKPLINQKKEFSPSLITQERTRKLDLIIHLISNSRQSLVICGPEGIGKSTLLKILQERNVESWLYCLVQGNAGLSFEKIHEQTARVIKHDFSGQQAQTLSGEFRLLESQRKKIVLMIDNAGHLAPGLINTIIEYAVINPVLRIVFVLTHDDLDVKNSSDSAIDACHLIEIPPLSKKQCGEFLQFLATKPRSQAAFNEISDNMIEAVYQETQGIPGRITTKIPGFEGAKQSDNSLRLLVSAVAVLVVLTLGIQWFSASKYNIRPIPTLAMEVQKPAVIENSLPQQAQSLHSQQNKHTELVDATDSDQHAGAR
jgi:DamX protein